MQSLLSEFNQALDFRFVEDKIGSLFEEQRHHSYINCCNRFEMLVNQLLCFVSAKNTKHFFEVVGLKQRFIEAKLFTGVHNL